MTYLAHLTVYLSIYIIAATGLNLALGYCGLLTLCVGAYYAIGAYTYAIVALNHGGSFSFALAAAIVTGAIFSVVLSLPAGRLSGDRFVILTLAMQSLVFAFCLHWFDPNSSPGTWDNLTNGSLGLVGIPKARMLQMEIDVAPAMAVVAAIAATACVLLTRLLVSSPWGRLVQAVRDDELAARTLGKRVRLVRFQCLAFSCAMMALAGAMAAAYVRFVDPTYAALDQSIFILCIVFIGGAGTVRGPAVGAVALLAISEFLRFLDIPSADAPNVRMLAYGLLIVLLMHLRPQGLAGAYRLE